MKQVCAEVGESLQQVGGTCPEGWIVMQGERPTPEHVAQADGSWGVPVLTTEQIAAQIRAERDAKIEAVRWRIERAKDEAALGVPLTEPLEPLLQYTQALRDVPQQAGFPENVEWPIEP